MLKIKTSDLEKLAAVERYQREEARRIVFAMELGVGENAIRYWVNKYKTLGTDGLEHNKRNRCYDASTKELAVKEYLSGKGS